MLKRRFELHSFIKRNSKEAIKSACVQRNEIILYNLELEFCICVELGLSILLSFVFTFERGCLFCLLNASVALVHMRTRLQHQHANKSSFLLSFLSNQIEIGEPKIGVEFCVKFQAKQEKWGEN
ncbi:hypothetical protein T4D_1804 [Trichinella pseudospiralis]|uniref:Uncharacterized protein n=1 Tax=Trichinella pseudospiralis TaxID=6337 RepID=A0A0V1FNJ5_TRIPS|nr:hypothetical protein T4D_1804 [Trichinella pseudospiralis]